MHNLSLSYFLFFLSYMILFLFLFLFFFSHLDLEWHNKRDADLVRLQLLKREINEEKLTPEEVKAVAAHLLTNLNQIQVLLGIIHIKDFYSILLRYFILCGLVSSFLVLFCLVLSSLVLSLLVLSCFHIQFCSLIIFFTIYIKYSPDLHLVPSVLLTRTYRDRWYV